MPQTSALSPVGESSHNEADLPVFWGSLVGLVAGSVISGLSSLGTFRSSEAADVLIKSPLVIVFCVLLCIRYYASITFLTYDPATSPKVARLEPKARRMIFIVQLLLVVGCSLNIAFLSVFGGLAAVIVICVQASLVSLYWVHLWKVHLREDEDSKFRVVLAIADLVILVAAFTFFAWEMGLATYDETGGGMLMGAILLVFIVECATNYYRGVRGLWRRTKSLFDKFEVPFLPDPATQSAGEDGRGVTGSERAESPRPLTRPRPTLKAQLEDGEKAKRKEAGR